MRLNVTLLRITPARTWTVIINFLGTLKFKFKKIIIQFVLLKINKPSNTCRSNRCVHIYCFCIDVKLLQELLAKN